MTELGEELERWIADRAGGRIVECRRQLGFRPAFFLEVAAAGGPRHLFLRFDRNVATGINRHYTVEREARVIAALHRAGMPVPEVLGFHTGHRVLLMSRLSGTADFAAVESEEAKGALLEQYLRILARIHALEPEELALDLPVPRAAAEQALHDAEVWIRLYEETVTTPDPAMTFLIRWLRRHAPATASRPVLLQGDTGPGQFLFEAGRITGIVDWEYAHFGDAMEDLASIRMRTLLLPCRDLLEHLERYGEYARRPLDRDRLRYFTVRTMMNAPLSLLGAELESLDPTVDVMARVAWATVFKRGACEAVAEATATALSEPEVDPKVPSIDRFYEVLRHNLQQEQLPAIRDPLLAHRMRCTLSVVDYLRQWSLVGPTLVQQEQDELAALLGRRPETPEAGTAALQAALADAGEADEPALIRYLYRRCRREEIALGDAIASVGARGHVPLRRLS